MSFLRGFARFWYDFIVGDDWKIALSILIVLALGTVTLTAGLIPQTAFTPVFGALIVIAFVVTLIIDVRRALRS